MTDAILTLNAGSSSLKFALFEVAGSRQLLRRAWGEIENLHLQPHLTARSSGGEILAEERWPSPPEYGVLTGTILDCVQSCLGQDRLLAAGHRVVHGGPAYDRPERITPELLAALDRLAELAPLHEPHNIAAIRAVIALRPALPQIACFDTAFHRTMPAVARRIAIPRRYDADGVRRYGFHGLSYEYISGKLRAVAPNIASGRVIAAHLGSGASLCAMRNGESLDTTMGFSALDGLVMGTRCGSIDPGVLFYLQRRYKMAPEALENMLYGQSGLRGVSGISGDMRTLLASPEPAAREAIELFIFRLRREIGALTASLNGLDGLIFTAGIGEHAPKIREMACDGLEWLGVKLDPVANARNDLLISAEDSRVAVYVIPTDEEEMIAKHTLDIVIPLESTQSSH